MLVPPLPHARPAPAAPPTPVKRKWGITLGRGHATITLLAYTVTREEAEAALRDLALGIGSDLGDWARRREAIPFYQVPEEGEPPYADLEHR